MLHYAGESWGHTVLECNEKSLKIFRGVLPWTFARALEARLDSIRKPLQEQRQAHMHRDWAQTLDTTLGILHKIAEPAVSAL